MIRFNSDYCEGAHERILKKLAETNLEQTAGYGEDPYCKEAADIIRGLCGQPEADVHFLVGGTQANMTVIGAALRPYQGAVSADTGHINVHETGAVESLGHKVLALPSEDGKIRADQVAALWKSHVEDESFEHMVQPGLVYISQPTELGTLYTADELKEMYRVCTECGLYLFVDGARLGYGLAAEGNDVDLQLLAAHCDVFYIGGTKVGALFGEAVVILNPALKKDFRYMIKQKGGMLAKGRLLGIQFGELLRDGLYQELGAHADRLADQIRQACREKGYPFLVENTTNQVFPILPDSLLERWQGQIGYNFQEKVDAEHTAVRLCTSWATTTEQTEALVRAIRG